MEECGKECVASTPLATVSSTVSKCEMSITFSSNQNENCQSKSQNKLFNFDLILYLN